MGGRWGLGLEEHEPAGRVDRAHERARKQLGALRVRPAPAEEGDGGRVMVGDQRRVAALQLRLAVEQPQHRAVGGTVVQPQHAKQGADERVERRTVGGLVRQQRGEAPNLLGVTVEDQVLLAREVTEDGPWRDPGRLGDLLDRRVPVTLGEEERLRRRDDLHTRAGTVSVTERRTFL